VYREGKLIFQMSLGWFALKVLRKDGIPEKSLSFGGQKFTGKKRKTQKYFELKMNPITQVLTWRVIFRKGPVSIKTH
jgi:hypothetical protein